MTATERVRGPAAAAGALLLGLLMIHGELLGSGLDRIPGDPVDSRLLHALLEHGYRSLTGQSGASGFWNPPFFHPAPNTLVYTETLAGTLPLYVPWRLLGIAAGPSFGLWMLSVSLLNFGVVYWLLRRPLGGPPLAAALGAFLFSFSAARAAQLGHAQLLPGFFIAFITGALCRLFEEGSPARLGAWAAAAALAMAAQVWTCFYVAWFFGLGLLLFTLSAFLLPETRPLLREFFLRRWPFLTLGLLLLAASVLPFAVHALAAARELGFRSYEEAEIFLPRPASWFWPGGGSWIYGGFAGGFPFDRFPDPQEHSIGPGWISLGVAGAGLWSLRRSPWGKALGLASLGLLTLTLSVGGASFWALVYVSLPGAGAIRAVCRVANVLLLPAAVGLSAWLGARIRPGAGLAALMLLIVLEQGRRIPSYSQREQELRVSRLAARIDPKAPAFLRTGVGMEGQVDAMWAALASGVPTVNGYSGNEPPGWGFASTEDARAALAAWGARHGADLSRVQILR